ncbi:DUF4252 domain-containing protein [Negadavirga shengliensis]|uniref:DUF4252 domain-containing protein n=1 Tax=Negadavirga shengliensis TaxID=1389218 RepID=A0ABV9T0Z0_9BACT
MTTLKTFLAVGILLCLPLMVQAQSKSVDKLYNKYKEDKDFFHMDLAGNFLDFAKGWNINFDEVNLETITESLERVRLFKLPTTASDAKADFRNLSEGLKKEKFDLLMETSEKDSGVAIYSTGKNQMKGLVVMIRSKADKEYMVIELEGSFDKKTLAKITK